MCQSLFFNKEALTCVFSFFIERLFYRTPPVAAPVYFGYCWQIYGICLWYLLYYIAIYMGRGIQEWTK